jgi:hypothetical protein
MQSKQYEEDVRQRGERYRTSKRRTKRWKRDKRGEYKTKIKERSDDGNGNIK